MIIRKVKTKLVGKDELFKVIALGEATRMPVLFVGNPGVAKTQTLMDYAAAMSGFDPKVAREQCFVLELDEGTKSSEIKGRVNMQDLLVNKKYTMETPIAEARYIMINEVDKGSSGVRNTMLSVMREKALFLGSEMRPCKWQLFAGSCNEIPQDQIEAPFWDRFLIKFQVERVKASDIYTKAWNNKQYEFELNIPEKDDMEQTTIDMAMMTAFAKEIYQHVSDRTLVAVPAIVKAIKHIWKYADSEAIMKACEMVCPQAVQALSQKLEDPAIVSVKSKIKGIDAITEHDLLMQHISTIENEIAQLQKNTNYTEKAKMLEKMLIDTMGKSENCQRLIADMKKKSDKFKQMTAGMPSTPDVAGMTSSSLTL